MLSSIGRAAIRRVGAGTWHASTNRGLQNIWRLPCVDSSTNTDNASVQAGLSSSLRRAYATVTKTTPPKKPAVTKPKTTKASAKKVVNKAVKKKPAPKKKKVAAKKKPKPKPKAKGRPKKVLSDEEKLKAKVKEWKAVALLSEPKKKPTAVWVLVLEEVMQAVKGTKGRNETMSVFKAGAAEASTKFKSLSPDEIEHYNQKASENKADNDIAHKKWVEQYTPDQIREANLARAALKKHKIRSSHSLLQIQDERQPLKPRGALNYFTSERWSSGDLKGLKVPEATALILKEFKDLPASERKVLDDKAAADRRRYEQEFQTVFHRDTHSTIARNRLAKV